MTAPTRDHPAEQTCDIRVEGVHKAFGSNRVLRGVSLEVGRGEIVAIVGGSGSGKTVLLHLMTGLHAPDRGRVLVADRGAPGTPLRDLAALKEEERDEIRVHWAVVFQRNALFTGTVLDNLALWPREILHLDEGEIEGRAREAVSAVGLDPRTVLSRHRDDLSGGMAKRVAIARALAMEPAMIFYDEPTSGLDPQNAGLIHELISRTHKAGAGPLGARTSLVVTHDTDLLRRLSPRVVMLHQGGLLFDGPYGDFERADAAPIRPYFSEMPGLNARVRSPQATQGQPDA